MVKNRMNSRGFTLVETAIVLIIGGLILTMLFSSLNIYMKNTKLSTTRERVAAIDEQIQIYLDDQGHLPCPAPLAGVGVAANEYGVESDCSITATGTFGNTEVSIGMAPTRTLNLPDDFGYDAWGNRIVYAVSRDMALNETAYEAEGGDLSVVDTLGNSVTGDAGTTHYVVFSPGINQYGAYNTNGALIINCPDPDATMDEENCNNDEIFRSTVLTSDAGGTNDYDDILISRSLTDFDREMPPGAVILFRLPACPNSWEETNVPASPPANHRYCRKN